MTVEEIARTLCKQTGVDPDTMLVHQREPSQLIHTPMGNRYTMSECRAAWTFWRGVAIAVKEMLGEKVSDEERAVES